MSSKITKNYEYPSHSIYYASGEIKREAHDSVPPSCGLTGFRIIAVEPVRQGGDTLEAYEITLKVLGNQKAVDELQPGVVFALEPKNHQSVVDAVLMGLKHEGVGQQERQALDCSKLDEAAEQRVILPVKSSYIQSQTTQRLSKRDVLAGTIDLSRPTPQLVNQLLRHAGIPAMPRTAEKISASYSIEQLLNQYPGLLTIEELCANQPLLDSRPYTISDYDRKKGTLKIVVSDVNAEIPSAEPEGKPKYKQHGIATQMLLDLAKHPKKWDYVLNGYVATHGPKLFFPCMTELTESMAAYQKKTKREYWQKAWKRFSGLEHAEGKTLFLLGTGSGIAPYMALLREYARRKESYPGDVILISGGRGTEGEMFADEIKGFVRAGILKEYHYADSKVKLDNGEKAYIQNVLKDKYGGKLGELLAQEEAVIFVGGAEDAKKAVDATLSEIAGFERDTDAARIFIKGLEDRCMVQSTASKPERFFNKWRDENHSTDHRKPMPEEQREKNPDRWTQRIEKTAMGTMRRT